MTLDQLPHVVKVVALIQLGILIASFFLFYVLRTLFKINDRRLAKKIKKMTQLLNSLINNQTKLTPKIIRFFKNNCREMLSCMRKIEDTTPTLPAWIKIKQQLSTQILKPEAKRLAYSSKWLKQYLAALCFEYGTNLKENDSVLSKLVHSDTFIVSLNAARVIFKYPTPVTINALIDSLAKGRRIQQSLYAEVLVVEPTQGNETLMTTFSDRVTGEQDPYVKTFCYRILMLLTLPNNPLKIIETDILSDNVDLKIATLCYLSRFQDTISRNTLRQFLKDPQPEVKAVVAKLIGEMNDEESIPLLEEKLHDSAWWVRINAAEALSKLGQKGILALQQQSSEIDSFAYETAQKVLITLGTPQ
ncbi:MAG: hypothetical protein A3F46_05830 [Legionellales bacterium RIFCSPHIGHO2_12_FULL_42_9]|nr:MAG: hypothetical protein A3F46_05830 [Legionellales bacterium RIFCSPHIGHO2_12_FULL_42_9]